MTDSFNARVSTQCVVSRMRSVAALQSVDFSTSIMDLVVEREKRFPCGGRQMIEVFFPNHGRNARDLIIALEVMFVYPKMYKRHTKFLDEPHRDIADVLIQLAVAGVETPTTILVHLVAQL